MRRWVALLRAVNLGSTNKVAMADLRALVESLGYEDVRTHLQSGNAVLSTGAITAAKLEQQLESSIAAELGVACKVLVRTGPQMAAVVEHNPFIAKGRDPKELHVAFLSSSPTAKRRAEVDPAQYEPDEFAFGDKAVYMRLANGVQGSRLPNWERVLGVTATGRSWKTVTRLHELVRG